MVDLAFAIGARVLQKVVDIAIGTAGSELDRSVVGPYLTQTPHEDLRSIVRSAWVNTLEQTVAAFQGLPQYQSLSQSARSEVADVIGWLKTEPTFDQIFGIVGSSGARSTSTNLQFVMSASDDKLNQQIINNLDGLPAWRDFAAPEVGPSVTILKDLLLRNVVDSLTHNFLLGVGKDSAASRIFVIQFLEHIHADASTILPRLRDELDRVSSDISSDLAVNREEWRRNREELARLQSIVADGISRVSAVFQELQPLAIGPASLISLLRSEWGDSSRIAIETSSLSHTNMLVQTDNFALGIRLFRTTGFPVRIRTEDIIRLLSSNTPTILMWWTEPFDGLYWADVVRHSLRINGLLSRRDTYLELGVDIQRVSEHDVPSVETFVNRVNGISRMWRAIQDQAGSAWISNLDFPISFLQVVHDPDVALFMPFSWRLIRKLHDHPDSASGSTSDVLQGMTRVGRLALRSPEMATAALMKQFGIPPGDNDFVKLIEPMIRDWVATIDTNRRLGMNRILLGFDRLIGVLSYQKPGDVVFPARFTAEESYPMGRLVQLLSPEVMSESLVRMVENDNHPDVIQFSAYYLGILNLPRHDTELRRLLKQLERRLESTPQWRAAHRQLKYAIAQMGDEQTQADFVRGFHDPAFGNYEAKYNNDYYGGDSAAMQRRFETRLESGGMHTDENVIAILRAIYDQIRHAN